MDELIGRLAADAGVDTAVAEKSAGIVSSFLRSEDPSDAVEALITHIPGAEAVMTDADNGAGSSSLTGGGLMAGASRLINLGVGMTDIQNAPREPFGFGRDKVGAVRTGTIIAGKPRLSQLA